MKLYKYVIFDRIDVLQNGFIRFTQPSALNDPFDLQPNVESLLPDNMWSSFDEKFDRDVQNGAFAFRFQEPLMQLATKNLSPEEIHKLNSDSEIQQRLSDAFAKISQMLTNKLAPKVKELQFDIGREVSQRIVQQKPSILTSEFGVLSLTEKADNLLMWAHYADSHKGFVIEFDSEHSFFKFPKDINRSALRKVDYIERKKLKTLIPADELTEPDWFFFQKSQYWSYENEWRLVRPLKDASKVLSPDDLRICLFELPPTCITGVILGLNISQEGKDKLTGLVRTDSRYQHVKFFQALPNYEEDRLDIELLG